jgi:DNA-directed RNA polymerase specialized sigma24 family protein
MKVTVLHQVQLPIRRILVNRCKNLLRGRTRVGLIEGAGEEDPDPAPGPEGRVEANQLWGEVMALAEDRGC